MHGRNCFGHTGAKDVRSSLAPSLAPSGSGFIFCPPTLSCPHVHTWWEECKTHEAVARGAKTLGAGIHNQQPSTAWNSTHRSTSPAAHLSRNTNIPSKYSTRSKTKATLDYTYSITLERHHALRRSWKYPTGSTCRGYRLTPPHPIPQAVEDDSITQHNATVVWSTWVTIISPCSPSFCVDTLSPVPTKTRKRH